MESFNTNSFIHFQWISHMFHFLAPWWAQACHTSLLGLSGRDTCVWCGGAMNLYWRWTTLCILGKVHMLCNFVLLWCDYYTSPTLGRCSTRSRGMQVCLLHHDTPWGVGQAPASSGVPLCVGGSIAEAAAPPVAPPSSTASSVSALIPFAMRRARKIRSASCCKVGTASRT